MARYLLIAALALLAGCAANGARDYPEKAGFFMVSKGEASFIYKLFGGEIAYCKATSYNLGNTEYQVEMSYDGEVCNVTGITEAKQ